MFSRTQSSSGRSPRRTITASKKRSRSSLGEALEVRSQADRLRVDAQLAGRHRPRLRQMCRERFGHP
jgi:hypothetical protein